MERCFDCDTRITGDQDLEFELGNSHTISSMIQLGRYHSALGEFNTAILGTLTIGGEVCNGCKHWHDNDTPS